MAYTPYITTTDFRTYTEGIPISPDMSDAELLSLITGASTTVDSYCQTSFQYRDVIEEIHDFMERDEDLGVGWEVYPYYRPIRTVTKFFVATGIDSTGNFIGAEMPVTPTAPVSATGVPPSRFGTVFVDNDRGFMQTSYQMLALEVQILRIFPQTITPVSFVVSYSAGYDDGTIQDDGYSLPVPDWLREATRLVAIDRLGKRNLYSTSILGVGGMYGLQAVSVADVRVTRFHPSSAREAAWASVPDEAKDLLRKAKQSSARYR